MYLVYKTYHKLKWKGRYKMEFNKTIAARQSVRKFTEAQITDEQLKAILEAANAAPACMGQYDHLHLTVVQKPEILAQINAAFQKAVGDPNMQVTYGAPTVIYVSCKNEDEEIVKGCNAGVVMENMLLEAIEGLKKKLDLELEKKWELIQQLRDEENSHQGLISFLWG